MMKDLISNLPLQNSEKHIIDHSERMWKKNCKKKTAAILWAYVKKIISKSLKFKINKYALTYCLFYIYQLWLRIILLKNWVSLLHVKH